MNAPSPGCDLSDGAFDPSVCGFQGQRSLKVSHDAAMAKVDELSDQLKEEKMKSLDMEKQLQASGVAAVRTQQVTSLGVLVMVTLHRNHGHDSHHLTLDCHLSRSCRSVSARWSRRGTS